MYWYCFSSVTSPSSQMKVICKSYKFLQLSQNILFSYQIHSTFRFAHQVVVFAQPKCGSKKTFLTDVTLLAFSSKTSWYPQMGDDLIATCYFGYL